MDDDAIDEFHLDAIADADPYPYWYDDADEPDCNPTLVRTETLRPVHRRRRLHRAVDGDHRQGARPVARRRADRRPRGRLGGQRPQRRVHGVEPHPRRRQRPGALPRRAAAARGARPAEPQRDRGGDHALRHRLRLRAHRASSTSPPSRIPPSYLDELRDDYQQLRSLGQDVEWLDGRRRCAPRSTRRPTPAGCGARTAPRSSTRRGWCGG